MNSTSIKALRSISTSMFAEEHARGIALFLGSLCVVLVVHSCNVFEPREAEPPSQSGVQYEQQTFYSSVVSNLQKAIGEKNKDRYIACFTNPESSPHPFTFVASADGGGVYASIFQNWTYTQEMNYFKNLSTEKPEGFSNLSLVKIDSSGISSDSRTYGFRYTLTFPHNDPTFTQTVRGTVRFTFVNDNSHWTISNWVDIKTDTTLTWTVFKGKFSD